MIICDTREKKNGHILGYFKANGVEHAVRKLDVGDYMNTERGWISVDRKRSLDELAGNLCTRDSNRFWREIRRSRSDGLRLIVLCEHGDGIRGIDDLAGWRSEHSRITGRMLRDRIYIAHISYHVEFLFCSKDETPQRILELLEYDKVRV